MKRILAIVVLMFIPQLCVAERMRGALEQFDLSQLRIVHIDDPGCDGTRTAYVEGPGRVNYLVRRGEYIGKADGNITEITDSAIFITELMADGSGGWLERKTQLHWDRTPVE